MKDEVKQDKIEDVIDRSEVEQLRREVELLKELFYKDNYSNLQVFNKKTLFKGDSTINKSVLVSTEITTLTETGGTAPIADGNHAKAIPDEGGTITITTKNGIITAIS